MIEPQSHLCPRHFRGFRFSCGDVRSAGDGGNNIQWQLEEIGPPNHGLLESTVGEDFGHGWYLFLPIPNDFGFGHVLFGSSMSSPNHIPDTNCYWHWMVDPPHTDNWQAGSDAGQEFTTETNPSDAGYAVIKLSRISAKLSKMSAQLSRIRAKLSNMSAKLSRASAKMLHNKAQIVLSCFRCWLQRFLLMLGIMERFSDFRLCWESIGQSDAIVLPSWPSLPSTVFVWLEFTALGKYSTTSGWPSHG